uniref:Uncharacterized protein n=1 Tax=Knipowitschia caucasica TaxID=637954 RepID=A0AAV2JCN8_KNICA
MPFKHVLSARLSCPVHGPVRLCRGEQPISSIHTSHIPPPPLRTFLPQIIPQVMLCGAAVLNLPSAFCYAAEKSLILQDQL